MTYDEHKAYLQRERERLEAEYWGFVFGGLSAMGGVPCPYWSEDEKVQYRFAAGYEEGQLMRANDALEAAKQVAT